MAGFAPQRHFHSAGNGVLAALLRKPLDYMDSPIFHEEDAEARMMNPADDVPMPNISWYHPLVGESAIARTTSGSSDGQIIRLTGVQERTLFRRYNYAKFRSRQIQNELGMEQGGSALRQPSPAAGREMVHWFNEAQRLRGQIAETNVGLVLAMARRTRMTEVDHPDLISEGNVALVRAIDKFNAELGNKFSTYACQAILKAFSRMAMSQSRRRNRFPVEYDPDLERSKWHDSRQDDLERDCAEQVASIVADNRCGLTDVERTVIGHRFGLIDGRNDAPILTLAQVGELLGLGKERVRQIQVVALGKIRRELEDDFLSRRDDEEMVPASQRN